MSLICVSLGTSSAHVCACLAELDREWEMAEIRVDLLSDPENLAHCFSKANELGIRTIATVRDAAGFTPKRKAYVLQCLEAKPTYVDIEVEAPNEYQNELVLRAKALGVKVIISHHNYEEKESSSLALSSVIADCLAKGADIAKVAVAVISEQGAARVLATYAQDADLGDAQLVSIGMGAYGKVTRLACMALGSPFSFAAWDERSATAPGQLTRAEMRQGLQLLSALPPARASKRTKL